MLELVISAIAGVIAIGLVWVAWNLYENIVVSIKRKAMIAKATEAESDTETEKT